MDRREFIKSVGVAGTVATGLSAMGGGLAANMAGATHHERVDEAADGEARAASGSAARDAMMSLLDTVAQTQARLLTPEAGYTDPEEIGEGQRSMAHILQTALAFWLEADPERPVFQLYVTPTRKLLGDNPDSIYYFAPIRDDRGYRIRGNVGAATFTSFTIESGSHEGHAARSSVAAISDDEMSIAPDGSYEIIVSREKPERGNWLQLSPGASQVTTRHYHEARQSVAANPHRLIPIHIEPLDPASLAPWGGDEQIAKHLEYVAHFVREHAVMSMTKTTTEFAKKLGWISVEANRFTKPGKWVSASGDAAYGNTHAYYASAPYELAPDEALIMKGRFPDCRFANVVLWNKFMQSFDFANRQISLNRKQIEYRDDGSFEIVLAASDPGVPNWLDTEGRSNGQVYWRYVYPIEKPSRIKTKLVKLSALG
jgi:hypothetical protein